MSRRLPVLLLLVLPLAACTWVSLKPEAKQVRVVPAGAAPAGCTRQGEIEVSVKHSVAFYDRNALRVREELDRHEGQFTQLVLDFDEDDKRQLETNMKSWRGRIEQFDRELEREPQRIRAFYEVRAQRVEPVGLVYLWPETN